MNLQKVKEIIDFYKRDFHRISEEEIYKWRAVKRFQETWDPDAENFVEMLERSLSLSRNLLDSGSYFPKRMLILNADIESERVRELFRELYDEERDWLERVADFRKGLATLTNINFPNHVNHYQDHRAVLVYLTLRFPDIYFFYKYSILEEFVQKVDYPYRPTPGAVENLTVYFNLCERLKDEITKDNELLRLHKERITENEFFDKSFNILTQDVIYATVRHFEQVDEPPEQEPAIQRLVKVEKKIAPRPDEVTFQSSSPNYIEKEKANKRIGFLGELLVLEYEQGKLKQWGSDRQPEHVAVTRGDGEGYDILSFGEFGEELFIEVKTTTSRYDAPFYVTRNELEKSKNGKESFYLYRVYEFDEKLGTAKFYARQGSLEDLCISPVLYRVRVGD